MEIFKDIKGYEGQYQVSNEGRVKSLNYGRSKNEGLMKPQKTGAPNENDQYHLRVKLDKDIYFYIHKLVGDAFIPNTEHKPILHHKNRNPEDNRAENLEWMTYEEHQREHSLRKGTHHTEEAKRKMSEVAKGKYVGENNPMFGRRGKDNPNSKPLVQLSKDGDFIREWECAASVTRELGIKKQNIYDCCNKVPRHKTAGGYRWMYKRDWEALTSQ